MLCMRISIKVLHKAYKYVFEQLYPSPCQNLQNKSESTKEDQNRITSK
jgi:hypothetical protein